MIREVFESWSLSDCPRSKVEASKENMLHVGMASVVVLLLWE